MPPNIISGINNARSEFFKASPISYSKYVKGYVLKCVLNINANVDFGGESGE